LGADGYLYIANVVMKTVELLRAGIAQIDDVKILGNPDMSVMALASDTLDIYQVGDELTARGWHLDRQQFPPSLHLTVHYAHAQSAEQFLYALQDAVNAAKKMSARKLMDNVLVDVANRAARVLPAAWVSQLTQRASTALGGSASGGGRSAALYGMIGTLPNRGDLHELVLDLVEGFTTPQ